MWQVPGDHRRAESRAREDCARKGGSRSSQQRCGCCQSASGRRGTFLFDKHKDAQTVNVGLVFAQVFKLQEQLKAVQSGKESDEEKKVEEVKEKYKVK